jgi:hypothetical protein
VIDAIAEVEQRELERRALAYRDDRAQPDVKNRVVILIDDGLATGSTYACRRRIPTPAKSEHAKSREAGGDISFGSVKERSIYGNPRDSAR